MTPINVVCKDFFMTMGYYLFDEGWLFVILVISMFVGVLMAIPRIIRIGNHDQK